jgi:YHS domain-containing protein
MNPSQPVSPALIARGITHRFNAKWIAISQSMTKCSLLVLVVYTLTSCMTGSSSQAGTQHLNLDSKGVILNGYDPVAYFTKNRAVKGNPQYQTSYQGAIYYFSSAANLETFKNNPSKYTPQYGGFCANSVANRKRHPGDPNVFFIANGKLYVCSSPAAAKEFRANEAENIKKADLNWRQQSDWWY